MSNKKDPNIKNISNVSITKECYIKLKLISVRDEITLQEVVADVLEKYKE